MASERRIADHPRDTPYQREQEAWQRQMEKAVGLALGQSLIDRKLLNHRIRDLELDELIAIGIDTCHEYARQRESRWQAEMTRTGKLLPME
jgi:hypothetical protein